MNASLFAFGSALTSLLLVSSGNAQILTGTNVGGWHLSLSISNNAFVPQETVFVSLIISNCTSRPAEYGSISYLGDARLPSCGDLAVVNTESHRTNRFKFVFPKTPSGIEVPVRMSDSFDAVYQQNPRVFVFNATKYWGVTNPGNYQAYFAGAIPSLTEPGKTNVFQTSPLHFTILRKDEMRRPEQED